MKSHSQMVDSGYAWLPRIPAHWEVKRFRRVFEESSEVNGSEPVGVMLSVSGYRGVEPKKYEHESQMRSEDMLENYRVVRPGQLAVNTMWLNYAGLGVSEHLGYMSPAYRAYWIRTPCDRRYIHHLLRSEVYVKGYTGHLRGIRPNSLQMDRDTLMSWPILLPPLDEQRAIADYLDRETPRIDMLIEEQQRLIEMLHERRQALIDNALPAEGVRIKLAALFEFHNGDRGASYPSRDEFAEEGVPFVNAGHLRDGYIDFSSMNYVSAQKYSDLGGAKLLVDDVLFCLRGSLGKFGVYPLHGGSLASSLVALRRISDRVQIPYFVHVLRSSRFRDQVSLAETGSAQPNLSVEQLRSFPIYVPSAAEQDRIVAYLDEQTTKIDTLIAETETFIDLARERRSALITAAVTGQIDVREVA